MKINHLDLFSGIGGFSLGLKQAGVETDYIGFSDIDKYANQVFKRRFKNAEQLGSITDIQPNRLPRIDLITFGFPCQDLSIAGKRGGLSANRSSLFFEAIKIIQDKKPKYFIFENVKGIFSSNGGKDFDIVLRAIADIGYDGQWELCNTRWYLPQNRERIYFVGHIRGEPSPKVFPLSKDDGETKKNGGGEEAMISNASDREFGWKDRSPCLAARDYKDPKLVKEKKINIIGNLKGKDGHECHNVHSPDGIAPTVRENHGKVTMVADYRNDEGLRIRKDGVSPCLATRRHSETDISTMPPIIKVHCTQQRGADRPSLTKKCDCGSGKLKQKCCGVPGGSGHLAKEDGTVYCLDTANTQAVEVKSVAMRTRGDKGTEERGHRIEERDDNVSNALNSQTKDYTVKSQTNIRRLTPNECSRLQGFSWKKEDGSWDDSWNDIGISDTQRYKQFGNAVSVPVVKAIMERLYKGENNAKQK